MMDISLLTVLVVTIAFGLMYRYLTRNDFYFADKPIPFLKPVIGIGNLGPLLMKKRNILEHFRWLYDCFPDAKVFGIYSMSDPLYIIRDVEMLKRITVKDFDHFVDHTGVGDNNGDGNELGNPHMLVMNTLVRLRGNKWRDMRATLSPAFTGSKMRQMFALIAECGQTMVEFYSAKCHRENDQGLQVIEVKEMFSRFTNDVIATAALGIKVDSFREENNAFLTLGKAVMQPMGFVNALKVIGYVFAPKLMLKMNVDFLSKEHDAFFRKTILETMHTRQEKNIFRPDMIDLLIQAKKGSLKHTVETTTDEAFAVVQESKVGKRNHNRVWTDDELIAQALIFFLAGFEPVASTLSFIAYELTRNVDIQARLYEEIMEMERALDGKPLSYEVLQAMQYMDMVVSETLRLWPIGILVERMCVKDYIYDDGQGCRFTIEKGRSVMASVIGFHHDPKYYPEPERFDPDRFSVENRRNINLDTYLPFGIGPRNCIGSRFALMEMKAIVYYLLLNFSFEVHEKTQIPLKLEKSPTRIVAEKGIWVGLKPRGDERVSS